MTSSKTYLITGGAGFIGSHLAEALLSSGNHVIVIDDLSTGRLENIAGLQSHPHFHFARAAIENEIVLDRLTSQVDVVIHLAAAVGVKLIVERPVQTIETNVGGTERVLQALASGTAAVCSSLAPQRSTGRGAGSRSPRTMTSCWVRPAGAGGPMLRARWSTSFLGLAYGREYGLPVVIFRLFNTVGPRQTGRYGMVIPRFVDQALHDHPLTVYGDGTQSRCFCDVSDAVRAIVGLAEHPDFAGARVQRGRYQQHHDSIPCRAHQGAGHERLGDRPRSLRGGVCARVRGHGAP